MVHHGFGGTEVGSAKTPDDVACEISKRKETIFAHVVESHDIPGKPFNVIWEFDPDRLPEEMTHEQLVKEINEIPGVHKGRTIIWTILRSYKNGKPRKKPRDYPGEPPEEEPLKRS